MLSTDFTKSEFLEASDKLLQMGVNNSKHPFHQFVIASLDNQVIQQRTVVLRKWVLKRRSIIFHTDIRSPKVKQLKDNPNCSILFYSKEDKVQLRFKCVAHVHFQDRLCNYLYSQTTTQQQQCYTYAIEPSHPILEKSKEQAYENNKISKQSAKTNFAACVCNFNELELLYLNFKSHIRIQYNWDKFSKLTAQYLVA